MSTVALLPARPGAPRTGRSSLPPNGRFGDVYKGDRFQDGRSARVSWRSRRTPAGRAEQGETGPA